VTKQNGFARIKRRHKVVIVIVINQGGLQIGDHNHNNNNVIAAIGQPFQARRNLY
jgi:hypothetical protein